MNLLKGWLAFMFIGAVAHYVFSITPDFWETVVVIAAFAAFRAYADRDE